MIRDKLVSELNIDEARRKKAYRDSVGKLSIGVGRNLDDRGLRDSEIDFMLSNDIDEVADELDRAMPWWRSMNDARQNVLANMCFNLGLDRLQGFKNTLASMRAGKYDEAAEGMLDSLWARQVGERAKRLAARMRKGEF